LGLTLCIVTHFNIEQQLLPISAYLLFSATIFRK
jgi:hypothetical protein